MSKRQIIMLLGLVIILVALFSGLPSLWNTILYTILGILIITTAYLIKPQRSVAPPDPAAPYSEHSPQI